MSNIFVFFIFSPSLRHQTYKRAFATIPAVTTPAIIFCSGFHCDWECRQSLRPPCVRLGFGLWLPILGNSPQHLTIPHFPFSSSGSRPRWGDFNPHWHMIFFTSNVQFVYLSLICFKARQSRTPFWKSSAYLMMLTDFLLLLATYFYILNPLDLQVLLIHSTKL